MIRFHAFFYISLFSILLGIEGVFLYQLQEDKVERRIRQSREVIQNQLNKEFEIIEHNVRSLQHYYQILTTDPSQANQELFMKLTSAILEDHPIQFSGYFALEKSLAQKYFGENAFLLGTTRVQPRESSKDFLKMGSFQILRSTDPIYLSSPKEYWYVAAKEGPGIRFSEIYFDHTYTKQWLITVAMGFYRNSGKFDGMVGIDVHLDELTNLTQKVELGQTGGVILIDNRSSRLLTRQAGERAKFIDTQNRFETIEYGKDRQHEWQELLKGQDQIDTFQGDDGRRYLVSSYRMQNVPWTVVSFQEFSEAFEPVLKQMTVLGLLGALGLLFLVWQSQQFSASVIQPLQKLMNSILMNLKSIQKDEALKVNIESSGYFEVKELSNMMNALVNSINDRMRKHIRIIEEERAKSFHSARMASIGRLAGNIAHEINSPLTALTLNTEVLMKDLEVDPPASERYMGRLQRIYKLAGRIANIVQSFLMLSRESHRDPVRKVSVKELIEKPLELCKGRLDAIGAKLIVDPIPDAMLYCRSSQISQAILNVLNNAYDAISQLKEKWVYIEFEEHAQILSIRITDSGTGISSEVAAQMMDPFYTTKDVNQGAGLGLSLAKSIFEEHHGKLFYDKESPHTSFVMEIPETN